MNDAEFLAHAFMENEAAIAFAKSIHDVSHAWDDLIDRDKEIGPNEIGRAFFNAMVAIPSNPFFQQHADALLPVMAASCFNYQIANEYEKGGDRERQVIAHVIRYSVADILVHVAFLVGGWDWVAQVGPEIRARAQRDTLGHFIHEVEQKREASHA
jgi:hypothetical protein